MKEKVYDGNTVEKCLKKASEDLKVPIEQIEYTVLEEKRGIFKKKASISVKIEKKQKINNDGKITIQDGIISVKNPKEGGKPAIIITTPDIELFVDEKEIRDRVQVFEHSIIKVKHKENDAERRLNIEISPDYMKVYLDIKYIPKDIYTIDDCEENVNVVVKRKLKERIMPKKYSVDEVRQELKNNGVNYGIIEENLKKIEEKEEIEELLAAEGVQPICGKDDEIEIKFEEKKKLVEDNSGKVDFKAIGHIGTVSEGDILAIKHVGTEGKDGIDVRGKTVRHEPRKKIEIRTAGGCRIVDGIKIISEIKGRPDVFNNVFSVNQVHEVNGDVDLTTGNIQFKGHIIVYGAVTEGMKIEAEKSIVIYKNAARAQISAKGDVTINGNVILSKITAGREDVFCLKFINNLSKLKEMITSLKETCEQVKKLNLLGRKAKDGEIVKILIENKFKKIPKVSLDVIKDVLYKYRQEDELIFMVKNKIIGLAPLNIKSIDELDEMIEIIDIKLEQLTEDLTAPVDINIAYCQDSTVNSSGNINITGKGEYVSDITAHDSIFFTGMRSVARGGVLKAKNQIKCNIVGSTGGVSTSLIVEKRGHIWAEIAYQNTRFRVGKQEHTLEYPCRKLHVYIDKEGELTIEKLKL
jgi:uncharacterized protein (DUF342 family)